MRLLIGKCILHPIGNKANSVQSKNLVKYSRLKQFYKEMQDGSPEEQDWVAL